MTLFGAGMPPASARAHWQRCLNGTVGLDMFNLLNRANLGLPDRNIASLNAAVISTLAGDPTGLCRFPFPRSSGTGRMLRRSQRRRQRRVRVCPITAGGQHSRSTVVRSAAADSLRIRVSDAAQCGGYGEECTPNCRSLFGQKVEGPPFTVSLSGIGGTHVRPSGLARRLFHLKRLDVERDAFNPPPDVG
jgi:hypothetical protein